MVCTCVATILRGVACKKKNSKYHVSFMNTVLSKFKMNQIGTGIRLLRIFAGTA